MKKSALLFLLFFITINSITSAQERTKVNPIILDDSFDEVSLQRLQSSVQTLEEVLNSDKFREAVLKETFSVGNNDLDSLEIYNLIMSGKDNYIGKPEDKSIDLRVKVFDKYAGSGNFGTTGMTSRETRTHRCFILQNNPKCYTTHLMHEYMHQIGFYDKKTWLFGTKTKSVPYKIGGIINTLIGNQSFCSAKKETCKKTN